MIRGKRNVASLLLALAMLLGIVSVPAEAWAQSVTPQAVSPNYSVDEARFGTGGQLCDNVAGTGISTNYCATSAVGETVVGNTTSPNFQAQGGANTYREEYIEVMLNNPSCPTSGTTSLNLGQLSSGSTKTAMAYFSVKVYLASGGYAVRTVGIAPTVTSGASYTLATPNIGVSTNPPGTEQFGINLAVNTTPTVGAPITQLPDSSFGTGQATSGYGTANSFKYVNGDIIANSNGQSSGTTCYTMSYLYNVSNLTRAGDYRFNQSLVATGTY